MCNHFFYGIKRKIVPFLQDFPSGQSTIPCCKKHHCNKTDKKCISTPTVNDSVCELWLEVAEMQIYA